MPLGYIGVIVNVQRLKEILRDKVHGISCDIALRRIPQNAFDD